MSSTIETPSKANTASPYRTLDMWRGLAALWVVMGHICSVVMGREPAITTNPLFLYSLQGQMGVVMFFVISGYCIAASAISAARKPQPLRTFCWARLKRIYPPYLASTLLMAAITVLSTHHILPPAHHLTPVEGRSWTFYGAAATITQIPLHVESILVVYWSLCYEIAFYGIAALALILAAMRSRAAFFTCLNAITVGSLLWLIAAHGACPFPLDLWFQFGLGMMVYQIISSPGDRASKVFFAIAVILAATYAIQYIGPHNLNRPSSRAETLFATVFALAVLALYRVDAAMMRLRVVRAFAWLGSISYSLYLTHMIMRPLFGRVAERMHWTGSRYGISFLVQIAADIAFAYLFHLLIERPFMSSSGKARQSEIHLAAPPSVPHSQVEEPRVAV